MSDRISTVECVAFPSQGVQCQRSATTLTSSPPCRAGLSPCSSVATGETIRIDRNRHTSTAILEYLDSAKRVVVTAPALGVERFRLASGD